MKLLVIGAAALALAACNSHEMNTTDVDESGVNTMAGNDIVATSPDNGADGDNVNLIGNSQRTDDLGVAANTTE